MKKQTLYLLIGLATMIVASVIVLVTFNNTVINDPETRLFGEPIELRNEVDVESSPGGQSFTYIDYKAVAYDEDGKKVGDVYNVKIRNAYRIDPDDHYGTIELLVGIDRDDQVYVSIIELDQSTWTVMGIQAYILETFNGIPYEDVETLPEFDAADPTAGATATDSTNSIKEAVLSVIYLHYDIVTDLTPIRLARYQALVAETASFTELDLSTDPTSIVVKAALYDSGDTLIGYAIEATASNGFGSLHLVIVTDTNGVIVAADFVDYGNSYFESEMNNAIADLVGETVTDDLTGGFILAAPSSTDTVPSMEDLMTDIAAAYDHIENGGA